jgi:hypothetical protein
MINVVKVVAFALVIVGLFASFSNFGIPRIEPALPPVEEVVDLSAITPEQFIALGGRIYEGRGTCTLCHNELGRAPMLEEAAVVAEERLADERYEGAAEDAESYLRESLLEPSAFVVAGFGKSGSNDTESPMPSVLGGAIDLSEAEIAAVTAFLQDLAGLEVTVAIPTDMAEEEPSEDEREAEQRAPLTTPEDAILEFACGACHVVGEEVGELGPDLNTIGGQRDSDYIRRAILDPNADIAEGFEADMMPADYGEQMYAQELEMLVSYLADLK